MQEEEGNVHQNGRARVGLRGPAVTPLLVVVRVAVILSKFSLSTLLHAFKYLTLLHSRALSDSLKSPHSDLLPRALALIPCMNL